jgi:hypothetical protein
MKTIRNIITFLLVISIVGWFAKYAQNEYGETLIAVSYLFVSILLNFLAYKTLKGVFLRTIYALSFFIFLPYILVLFPNALNIEFQDSFYSIIILATFLLCIIFPFSLIIYTFFKKIKTDTFVFAEHIFLALIALGFFAKYNYLAGASIYIIVGSCIFILYFLKGLTLSIKGIVSKQLLINFEGLLFLFCGFFSLSFCFKIQHWPGASILGNIGLFCLALIILLYFLNRNKLNLVWWQQRPWLRNYIFIAMSISSIVLTLNSNGSIPDGYSNKFPNTYYQLRAKANNYTKEGIESANKAEIYKDAYFDFIDQQNRKDKK